MPFTRIQLAQLIQSQLEDALGQFYPISPDINESIQDGYDEILMASGCYQQVVSQIPFQGNQIYYDLTLLGTAPQTIHRPSKMFNYMTNRWIDFYDTRYFTMQRQDFEVTVGTTWWASMINFQYLCTYPHNGVIQEGAGTQNFDLFVRIGQDPLLSDNQVIQIPDPHEKCLQAYCLADLLEQQQEFSKASVFWEEYEDYLQNLTSRTVNRGAPQILRQYEDLPFPYANIP
jgi:hypothetical protein